MGGYLDQLLTDLLLHHRKLVANFTRVGYLDQQLTDLLLHHNKSVANITFYGECNLTFLKRH